MRLFIPGYWLLQGSSGVTGTTCRLLYLLSRLGGSIPPVCHCANVGTPTIDVHPDYVAFKSHRPSTQIHIYKCAPKMEACPVLAKCLLFLLDSYWSTIAAFLQSIKVLLNVRDVTVSWIGIVTLKNIFGCSWRRLGVIVRNMVILLFLCANNIKCAKSNSF